MAERDRFEFDLAAALRAYLEDAPTGVRPTELARQFATVYPHRRTALGRWAFKLTPAMAWVLLLVGLLLALVMGGLVAGAWQADHAVVIAPPAMFSPTGSMTTARVHHTATLLADGRVLIAGGNGDAQAPLATAEIYEPKTGTFGATGSMTTARAGHTATLLPDGRVLIAGGYDPNLSNATGSFVVFASAELYDPATGRFSPTGSMTTARGGHTATLLADGRVLIAGGDGALASALASAEIYDPKTGAFSPTDSMTTGRVAHTATLLADGRVLVTTGYDPSEFFASAEIYDPKTGTFGPTGSMKTARVGTATLLPDGRVLVAGGESLATAEIYDPKNGSFGPTGSMATARQRHTATLLANGRVLVAGGIRSFDGGLNASAELYDPTTGSFGPTSSMTTIREWHTATLLADGRVLVTGGDGAQAPLASADIFVP